jgi:hypothetical protein
MGALVQSIVFTIRAGLDSDERHLVLERVGTFPGVHRAAALSPHAKNPETQRMCYAYVADGADVESIRREIAAQPEVETAAIPAQRGLV